MMWAGSSLSSPGGNYVAEELVASLRHLLFILISALETLLPKLRRPGS